MVAQTRTGTLQYMAPELFDDCKWKEPSTNINSLQLLILSKLMSGPLDVHYSRYCSSSRCFMVSQKLPLWPKFCVINFKSLKTTQIRAIRPWLWNVWKKIPVNDLIWMNSSIVQKTFDAQETWLYQTVNEIRLHSDHHQKIHLQYHLARLKDHSRQLRVLLTAQKLHRLVALVQAVHCSVIVGFTQLCHLNQLNNQFSAGKQFLNIEASWLQKSTKQIYECYSKIFISTYHLVKQSSSSWTKKSFRILDTHLSG